VVLEMVIAPPAPPRPTGRTTTVPNPKENDMEEITIILTVEITMRPEVAMDAGTVAGYVENAIECNTDWLAYVCVAES
jgi:hypothetical protein